MQLKLPKVPDNWEKDSRNLPIVQVEWTDACTQIGWKSWYELETAELAVTRTIGYLLPSTKDIIKIAPTISSNGEFADTWMIPKGWVIHVKVLK